MTQFKSGDRVRIARQPSNQWVSLVGEVGVIDEVHGDLCTIDTFDLSGGCGGSGSVPLDCLEPFSSPALEEKVAERQAAVDRLCREADARRVRWNALVIEMAAQYSVDPRVAEALLNRGREWSRDDR